MKNWSPALQMHYAQRVTTLADCWRIQPLKPAGAAALGFTSHQRDLVVDGLTYQAVSFSPSDAKSTAELSVDTMELHAFFTAAGITQADIDAGILDGAQVENFEVDYAAGEIEGAASAGSTDTVLVDADMDASGYIGWEVAWLTGANAGEVSIIQSVAGSSITLTAALATAISAGDTYRIRKGRNVKLAGTIGEMRYNAEGVVIFELDSLARQYQQAIGNKIGAACINEFGDAWCQFDLQSITVSSTVTAITGARDEFGDSGRAELDDYFKGGLITWTAGSNDGYQSEVRAYKTGSFELVDPPPFDIEVGDSYDIRPTCWKRLENDCRDKWDNVDNFRGFPNLIGERNLYAGPDFG